MKFLKCRLTRLLVGWVGLKISTRLTKKVGFGSYNHQPVYSQPEPKIDPTDPLPALARHHKMPMHEM